MEKEGDKLGLWEQVLDMLCMCCQLQVQTSPKKQSEKLLNQCSDLSLLYNDERHMISLKQELCYQPIGRSNTEKIDLRQVLTKLYT